MKKLGLIVWVVLAVVAAPITERTTVQVMWDSDDTVSRPFDLFENGVWIKRYQTNEIFLAGVTNAVYTRYVRYTGPKNGEYQYVGQLLDTNNVPSELSNVYTQYFRLTGPKGLRFNEK